MKSILIDIDVILDVLARREPFFAPAVDRWAKVENKHIRAYLASNTITTLFYLIRKVKDKKFAEECVRDLLLDCIVHGAIRIMQIGPKTLN